jgi:O-antigen/teichoic acid export membrane protein
MMSRVRVRLRRLRESTFFMNAFYLMLSTFVVAAFGFIFWAVVTKSYSAAAVGLATTLLSVSSLLGLLGLAGFDTTFVRFLPRSDRKNDYINTGLIIVTILSGGLAIGVAAILPLLIPDLSMLADPGVFIGFVFFTIVTSLNVLTNAVFLAFKRARYIFIINTLFSIFKVVLPVLVSGGDAMTIFVIAGSAQLVGLILSIMWMRRQFDYKFSSRIYMDMLRNVKKFSFSVYVSSIMNLLPPTLLPLIVVHHMGPANAAYYYMAFTLASVLYTVAYASMQSAFAEGSHDEAAMHVHITKAAKLVAVLLLPAALLTALLSNVLLGVFGHDYAREASVLLQLFAIGSIPVALSSAMGAIFKVTKNLRGVVGMNVMYAAVTLTLSYLLMPVQGLLAVGWAWVIGNLAACGVGAVFLIRMKFKRQGA